MDSRIEYNIKNFSRNILRVKKLLADHKFFDAYLLLKNMERNYEEIGKSHDKAIVSAFKNDEKVKHAYQRMDEILDMLPAFLQYALMIILDYPAFEKYSFQQKQHVLDYMMTLNCHYNIIFITLNYANKGKAKKIPNDISIEAKKKLLNAILSYIQEPEKKIAALWNCFFPDTLLGSIFTTPSRRGGEYELLGIIELRLTELYFKLKKFEPGDELSKKIVFSPSATLVRDRILTFLVKHKPQSVQHHWPGFDMWKSEKLKLSSQTSDAESKAEPDSSKKPTSK